jgi:Fic family protein
MTENEFLKMQEMASKKFDLHDIDSTFIANLIFNSLSFERKFITLEEVTDILAGRTEGIAEDIVTTVQNHQKAFLFIVDLVRRNEPLTESTLKDCHDILMNAQGGLYRNVDISIHGSNHTPPSHLKVYDRMKKYFNDIDDERVFFMERIAYGHLQLAKIHPFLDGNGRLARLVLNYGFLRLGLAPIIIPYTEKEKYFQMLEEFKVNKNIQPFVDYITNLELTYLQ